MLQICYKLPFKSKNQIQIQSSGYRLIAQKRYRFSCKKVRKITSNIDSGGFVFIPIDFKLTETMDIVNAHMK